jgi:hypothetical protein
MNVELNMLGSLVMNRIVREVDRANVVAKDDACLGHWDMELAEKVPQPATFSGGIGDPSILGLG